MKKILSLVPLIILVSCGNMGNKNDQPGAATQLQAGATGGIIKDSTKLATNEAVPADWKTFTHSNYSIQYPAKWRVELDDTSVEFTIESPDSASSSSAENLNLVKRDMAGAAFSLDQMPDVVAQLKNDVTGFDLISSDKLKNGAGEYQRVVYAGTQDGVDLVFEQRFYILHDTLYILTLTAMHSQWDKLSPIGDQILNTFAVKN
jgi:hypothetical protein